MKLFLIISLWAYVVGATEFVGNDFFYNTGTVENENGAQVAFDTYSMQRDALVSSQCLSDGINSCAGLRNIYETNLIQKTITGCETRLATCDPAKEHEIVCEEGDCYCLGNYILTTIGTVGLTATRNAGETKYVRCLEVESTVEFTSRYVSTFNMSTGLARCKNKGWPIGISCDTTCGSGDMKLICANYESTSEDNTIRNLAIILAGLALFYLLCCLQPKKTNETVCAEKQQQQKFVLLTLHKT